MRSQIFWQIVQKFCRHTVVCQEIFVRYCLNTDNTTTRNIVFLIVGIIITSITTIIYFLNYTKIGVGQILKFESQTEWGGRMNNIRARATEIVNTDLIYT